MSNSKGGTSHVKRFLKKTRIKFHHNTHIKTVKEQHLYSLLELDDNQVIFIVIREN